MTHARTLPRYVGIAGLVAGLLAPVPSLAVAPGATAEILTVGASGQSTTSAIGAKVNAAYRHAAGSARYYKNLTMMIPRAQLRTGALAVLSAGRLLPGLAIAATAAGLFIDMDTDVPAVMVDGGTFAYPSELDDMSCFSGTSGYSNTVTDSCLDTFSEARAQLLEWLNAASREFCNSGNFTASAWEVNQCFYDGRNTGIARIYWSGAIADTEADTDETVHVPASEDDLASLDAEFPDEIVDEIADKAPEVIPAWTDAISVVPDAAAITSDVAAAPAVYEGVSTWANAMSDAMEGVTDDAVDGTTAAEAAYEQSLADREQAVPAFGEVTPEWQVETIDSLPSYSIGLGGGSCPAPAQIDIPLYGSITLDWQPACDLAGMLRGAVIGVCMILSLYIVLRGA